MRLIDADEAERLLSEWDWQDVYLPVHFKEFILDETPTVDAAPVVHGRWVQCFEDWRKQIEGDKCSACGFEHYGNGISHYHYCPNCGAKMCG